MTEQKALVVYYSRTGTTRKVAEAVAGLLQCDIEEVIDTKRRAGVLGFLGGGKDSVLKKLAVIEEVTNDPGSYDLVIIGTPVWGFSVSAAIRSYLSQHGGSLREVAFVCTRLALGANRAFRHLGELCGKEPVAVLGLKRKEVVKGDPMAKIKAFVAELRG
ncbi:MAG: flavodoxin family protein [Planctomycetota bacterium]